MASAVGALPFGAMFYGVSSVDRYMAGQCGTDAEADKAREVIGQWRERLSDIS